MPLILFVKALMKEWSGIEIQRARQGLEQVSATVLGHMIFEFSRLEVVLGLFLVWADGGSDLERPTKIVSEHTFHKKLDFLQELVHVKYSGEQQARLLYAEWLKDAHAARSNRNDLVHGRWGVDAVNNRVVNVVGLPTSSEQVEKRYTIAELKSILERIVKLQTRLAVLRERWPV